MKKHYSLTLFTALLLLLFSCGGDPVTLSLNVAKGDKFECKVKIDQKVETKAMGNMKINQLIEVTQTLTADNITSAGNVVFTNVMERFYMKQSMNMMGIPINTEFDTDHPEKSNGEAANMGQYFEKMKGLTYQMELDKQGKLISSTMDEAYEKLGLDTLSQQGGNNSGGNNADQYMSQLPSTPIKEGDSYSVESSFSSMGDIKVKNTYTVKEIKAETVVMDMKTEFINGEGQISEGMSVKISGDQSGVVEIDRKTGMTIKSEMKQKLKMTIKAAGTEMPMQTDGTIVFTCTKK